MKIILLLLALLVPASTFAKTAFRVRWPVGVAGFDWTKHDHVIDAWFHRNIMEGLFQMTRDGQPSGQLAERFTVSADRKTYVFYLRDGVRWSDGEPLVAQQFIDAWKRQLAPERPLEQASRLFDIQGAEEFHSGLFRSFDDVAARALDDRTIEVRLWRATPFFTHTLLGWWTFPVREDLICKHGDAWSLPENLVVLGPYKPIEHVKDKITVIGRNENYYGPKPSLDELHGIVEKNDLVGLKMYNDDKLDYYSSSHRDQKRLPPPGSSRRLSYTFPRTSQLFFNQWRAPFDELSMRKAVAMALDRRQLGRAFAREIQGARSFLPSDQLDLGAGATVPFDPSAARRLVAQATKRHPRLAGRVLTLGVSERERDRLVGAFLVEQLRKNAGLKVKLKIFPWSQYPEAQKKGEADMFVSERSPHYMEPHAFFIDYLSNAYVSQYGWGSPDYDALVNEAATLPNGQARASLYRRAARIVQAESVALVPLYFVPLDVYLKKRVRKYEQTRIGDLYLKNIEIKE